MPRRCTVCDHLERHSIDQALVTGAPYRRVAKRSELSESVVYCHQTEHPPAHLLKAREVEVAAREPPQDPHEERPHEGPSEPSASAGKPATLGKT